MLALFLSLLVVQPNVEVHWVCAGNSYMALDKGSIDLDQCDGWLVVDGEPVSQFWGASLLEDECPW